MRPKLLVCFPFDAAPDPTGWSGGKPLSSWAAAVEEAGFDGIAVTDHPFPSSEWLATGHHALDPLIALTAFAGSTERVRLITDILVAGYRNPYLLAKSIVSLDVLSGGRLTVGMGGGYQEAEFKALGAVYAGRGRRFDAALDAIYDALTGNHVAQELGPYPTPGNTMLPRPIQRPHPPFWIGGNSDAAMRRAAHKADGWMPFPQPRSRVAVSGSPALGSLDALAVRIGEARAMRSSVGLPPLEFCSGIFARVTDADLAPLTEEYGDAGVTWLRLLAPGATMAQSIERVHELANALCH